MAGILDILSNMRNNRAMEPGGIPAPSGPAPAGGGMPAQAPAMLGQTPAAVNQMPPIPMPVRPPAPAPVPPNPMPSQNIPAPSMQPPAMTPPNIPPPSMPSPNISPPSLPPAPSSGVTPMDIYQAMNAVDSSVFAAPDAPGIMNAPLAVQPSGAPEFNPNQLTNSMSNFIQLMEKMK